MRAVSAITMCSCFPCMFVWDLLCLLMLVLRYTMLSESSVSSSGDLYQNNGGFNGNGNYEVSRDCSWIWSSCVDLNYQV